MIRLLRDVSIDGRYIGFVLLIWTFPMSTLLLIIGPKVLAFRRAQAESSGGRRKQPTRGRSLGGVHLSGLSGLTASCDTAIVRTTPPDSQASYVDEEPRGPVNGSHFAEQIDHGKLPVDLFTLSGYTTWCDSRYRGEAAAFPARSSLNLFLSLLCSLYIGPISDKALGERRNGKQQLSFTDCNLLAE
jgi:hypothetical protein